jgi:MSHA biogenesis protein MshI
VFAPDRMLIMSVQEVGIFGFSQKRDDLRNLVGIGLTDEGIALACLSRDGETAFTLTHTNYADYISVEQMEQQLRQWVSQYQLKNKLTNFSLAPHQFSFVLTETPEVEDQELVNAMQWKTKELLDMDMDELVIDCLPIPGQKQRGRQAMAYVVAADIDVLKSYVGILEKSELALRSIDIPAMVQRNIASLLPEDKHGVALLNLYQRSGLLTITRGGDVYLARDLEVGYTHFADPEEDTKGMQLEGLPSATQSTLDAIVLEVQRSIDYYERYFAQPPINSLVIAPLQREVPGMVEYIASQLGLQVRELDLNVLLGLPEAMPRTQQSQCLPAIGAALRWPFAS